MAAPQAKHRMCRRVGAPLCGRPDCPALRRPYPPGEQRRRIRRRESEYGVRLLEKQKLRALYGMREAQFRRFYELAERAPGPTGPNLLTLLERRLDNLVLRLGFAVTIHQARQLVNHRHVLVDGQRVDRPSYVVEPGQSIEIREKDLAPVREALAQSPTVPPYLERDEANLRGRLLRLPDRDEIPYPLTIDERLVVEFYARR